MKSHETADNRERLKLLLNRRARETTTVHSADSSIIPIRPGGKKTPLYCVLGGGGGVPSYSRLSNYLDLDRPIYGLQTTRATPDDPTIRSVEKLAGIHYQALTALPLEGPIIFCGHSMGATVAFELAQQLIRAGKSVDLLVIIDQPGPDVNISLRQWLYWQWASISHLRWRQRIEYVAESLGYRLRTSRKTPTFVRQMFYSNKTKEKPAEKLPVSRAELRRRMTDATLHALNAYVPKPYFSPVALFRAESGAPRLHADPMGGWGKITDQKIQVYEIPGKHMNIFQLPHVALLAEKLDLCLSQCE